MKQVTVNVSGLSVEEKQDAQKNLNLLSARESAIYKIEIECESRVYIGSAVNCARRFRQHKHLLAKDKHHCKLLQDAYNKRGGDGVSFCIVRFVPVESLQSEEQAEINSIGKEGLLNTSMSAYNPMRDNSIASRWSNNLSREERDRRSELMKEIRSSEGFEGSLREGRDRYLSSGGREELSALCSSNYNRRKSVSKMMKERWLCQEYREKMTESIKRALSVRVKGICLKTKKIYVFNSTAEAGVFLGDKGRSGNVRSCLIGKQKTAYGYTWEYL